MDRRVVYLDHSVLSQLAKDPSSPLLRDLTALVEANKVVFPYSWTHHHEAELASHLEDAIRRVAATLSRGIRFHAYPRIVAQQAVHAYLNFIGQDEAQVQWSDAYEHNPRGQISDRLVGRMLNARVTTSPLGRERRRDSKDLYARSLNENREARSSPLSFELAKNQRAEEAVAFYFERPQQQALAGGWTDESVAMLQFSGGVADLAYGSSSNQPTPNAMLEGLSSMFTFFTSTECQSMPFIDIESSILASLEADENTRPYSPSDFYDVETWSAYLPYVDVAVADRQMHQVLSRRGLAEKFGCSVLPHTEDGLRELIAEL